jgi:hypothetical protein
MDLPKIIGDLQHEVRHVILLLLRQNGDSETAVIHMRLPSNFCNTLKL